MSSIPKFDENPIVTIKTITGVKNCDSFPFFKTPYFKKYYRSIYEQMNDSSVGSYDKTIKFFEFYNYTNNIAKFCTIWGSIPNDHFQNHRDLLTSIAMMKDVNTKKFASWMCDNLSYESFFNMIRSYSSKNRIREFSTLLNDTLNQLVKLFSNKKFDVSELSPKYVDDDGNTKIRYRWRMNEFHDYVSYVFLKANTVNRSHNNTLIPSPVDIDDWVIQQPKDTIQLKVWAQKVHNCVASYEDRILNGTLKIILIERDSLPVFTVEIEPDTSKGVIIKQMVEQCNRPATSDERNTAVRLIERAILHHNPKATSSKK